MNTQAEEPLTVPAATGPGPSHHFAVVNESGHRVQVGSPIVTTPWPTLKRGERPAREAPEVPAGPREPRTVGSVLSSPLSNLQAELAELTQAVGEILDRAAAAAELSLEAGAEDARPALRELFLLASAVEVRSLEKAVRAVAVAAGLNKSALDNREQQQRRQADRERADAERAVRYREAQAADAREQALRDAGDPSALARWEAERTAGRR